MLKVTEAGFTYGKGPLLFSGISFEVKEGETLAILGPNGIGNNAAALHYALSGALGRPDRDWRTGRASAEERRVLEGHQLCAAGEAAGLWLFCG